MTNTTQDYWKSVKDIATEAREEHPNPDDDDNRQEYIWESVDGTDWITYYSNNETVLDATNNHDAIDDVGLEATTDWKQTRMICAFYAMLQDVNDEMGEK